MQAPKMRAFIGNCRPVLFANVLSFTRTEVAVVYPLMGRKRGRGDSGGEHRFVDGGDRFEGGLEIARAKTFGD